MEFSSAFDFGECNFVSDGQSIFQTGESFGYRRGGEWLELLGQRQQSH